MSDASFAGRPAAVQDRVTVVEVSRRDFVELHVSGVARRTGAEEASAEARELYTAIAAALDERKARVVQERVYGALGAEPAIFAARRAVLSASASGGNVPPTFLQGRPCEGDGLAGVHLCAVAPVAAREPFDVEEITYQGAAVGRLFERGGVRYAYLSGMAGTTSEVPMPVPEQADGMFRKAEAILAEHGFTYPQVARTWIYIGDILGWYDEFNAVRTTAYREFCVISDSGGRLPASTGIQARSPGQIECVMDLLAVSAAEGGDLAVEQLHNPLQNEAYAYGSSFARAMEVVTQGARTVYVSGTASIDEWGESIHLDDIDGQIERTVLNIEALIGTRGLTLDDIGQATVFLKRAGDIDRFRTLCAGTVFDRLGVCMVADVCRAELLFEIDAVAAGQV
jgi:enamine deaminase RidA (YjgF/YER057c/UK114 family)